MASEATKMAVIGNMHIDSKVMEVIQHHMHISHSPCRRRSKGPLPSCYTRGIVIPRLESCCHLKNLFIVSPTLQVIGRNGWGVAGVVPLKNITLLVM